MRVLVIHGANLNLLGEREPQLYGTQTLAEIDADLLETGRKLGIEVRCVQHNSESAIIDALHAARTEYRGIVLNPGAYTHYSYAIADAIAAIRIPVIEVHLTNIAAREPHRRTSVTASACAGSIVGFGARSYRLALHALREMLEE